jgi:6-phosphogluconolactonase (cycloisomerase 2 family)
MNYKRLFGFYSLTLASLLISLLSWSQAQGRVSRIRNNASGTHVLAPAPLHPRFAYVSNEYGTIGIYTVVPQTGQMRAVTYVLTPGLYAGGSALDAASKFLYVSNFVSNSIAAFAADSKSGNLTPLAGSPFASGNGPGQIVRHPSGKFLYVVSSSDNTIWGYSLNAITGALTPVPGTPTPAGATPIALAITSSGKQLYTVDNGSSTLHGFSVNLTTGQLTDAGSVPVGSNPQSVTITPSGLFAYVTNFADQTISGFSIASNGHLTQLAGSPFPAGGFTPKGMAIEPAGKFAYVVNPSGGGTVTSAFSINATTGALSLSAHYGASLPFANIALDPSGKFVLLSDGQGVERWAINATTGALKLAGDVESRGYSISLAISTGPAAISYKPQFVYALNEGQNIMSISEYTVNPTTGLLTEILGSPVATGSFPGGIVVDRQARFVYVEGGSFNNGTISAFTMNPLTGALLPAPVPTYNVGGPAGGIAEDPTGRFLYVSVGPYYVAGYSINPVDGTLTAIPGSPFNAGGVAPVQTTALAMDPLGRFLYVDNTNANFPGIGRVAGFQIDQNTGSLTLLPWADAEDFPISLAVSPSGQQVFGVDEITADLVGYGVDPSTGRLSGPYSQTFFPANSCPVGVTTHPTAPFLYVTVECAGHGLYAYKYDAFTNRTPVPGSPFFASEDPGAIAIEPSGRFVYATHPSLGSLEAYRINQNNGQLTAIPGSTVSAPSPNGIAVFGVYK